jgi:hypothetical protein
MQLRRPFVSISEIIPSNYIATPPRRPRLGAAPAALPAITPGQLWLIELPVDGAAPASVRHALDGVNVVIYDRALAGAVAEALPFGSYAEPASTQSDAIAARCVRFARDGWSVARLMPACVSQRERTRRVQDVVDELAAARVAGRLPVSILAETADGIEERYEARFDDLAAIVDSHPGDTLLAIVIDAFGDAVAPARLHAVAGNGLAG